MNALLETRTQSRSDRTRSALISAGIELLGEQPIDAIPIDRIVAAAGVGKGSFFNHFDDKQAFGRAIARHIREEMEARVAAANADTADPLQRLVSGVSVFIAFAQSDPVRATVMLRGHEWATDQHNPLNQGLRADIAAATGSGLIDKEAALTGLSFVLGVCQMTMIQIIEQRLSRRAAADCFRGIAVLLLRGLGAPAERINALSEWGARQIGGALVSAE
jgi:AcrR family transcriptional regulator